MIYYTCICVDLQVEPSPNKGPFKVPGNVLKYELKGLTPYTNYKFTIAVDSPAGRIAWSEVKEVRTSEDSMCF